MATNRNLADFYNEIQNQNGLRYGYQFLVKLSFPQRMFDPADRGQYSEIDNVLFAQYGIAVPQTLGGLAEANPQQPTSDLTFFAQSTSIPQTQLATTKVAYFAQSFEFPGIIKYGDTWTVNIILDQKMTIYRQLRLWQEMMSSIARNSGGNKTIPNVKGDVQLLNQYGDVNQIQRRYLIQGIYPTNVPQIEMEYVEGSNDLKKIDVQFAMQYFRQIVKPNDNLPSEPFQEYFT